MTWTNRIVWQEGMFLRAQHFQQQDRWLEQMVRERTAALRPHGWGMVEIAINRDLLTTGQFALASAAGVFEDGTPFALPGETDQPPPLELPENTRNAVVYLVLPIRQAGALEIATDNSPEGRYGQRPFEAYDTHSGSPQPAELQVGRLRLRYMLETENRAGYHCIGVARVVEIGSDRRVTLDDRWIPPALLCSATPPLSGLLTELSGMLNQRGEALAARLTAPGSRGVADVSDFLLLQSVNRAQKLLSHWADAGSVHPADLYAALVQMAGDFATFTEATRRPSNYPPYRHADLQRSFAPVVADLRRSLSAVPWRPRRRHCGSWHSALG
jgi:type VI secretion system protein ImpJ